MKILADENIPLVHHFFDSLGEVDTFHGRHLETEQVKSADVLLVRSITNVNQSLLEGSSVKFVGTCTIGYDHIDRSYLDAKGIKFAHAPGCNANSVVEYVISCLSVLMEQKGIDLDEITLGIVGFGNVGSALGRRLKNMGVNFRYYDPFLSEKELDPAQQEKLKGLTQHAASFEEVLTSDVISLHTPLTTDGPYPTYHLFDAGVLAALNEKQVLINTGRGAVIDNKALLIKLSDNPSFTVILDVWENEPNVDLALAKRVTIATPHIAGYSLDGKVAGTEMIYHALCQYLGLPQRHKAGQFMPEPPLSKLAFTSQADHKWAIHTAIRACYDVRFDHSLFKASFSLDEKERAEAFDKMRKQYRNRREFSNVKILLKKTDSELFNLFKSLGFNVKN